MSLLDLNTLVDRPKITIDGEVHEIVSPEELSVLDHQRLARHGRRIDELMNASDLSHEQEQELTHSLGAVSDVILRPIPREIRNKLTEGHILQVIEVFSRLPQIRRARIAAATTGEKSSPGFNGSTEEIQPDG